MYGSATYGSLEYGGNIGRRFIPVAPSAPIITFTYQNNGALPNPIPYSTTVANQAGLPVLVGEPSDHIVIRIYNNYNCVPNVVTAYNIEFQMFDTTGLSTQSTEPVAQAWMHMTQTGFGENSLPAALYTVYGEPTDTAVGGSASAYLPSYASNGSLICAIRAGNGCGMIEFDTYLSIPVDSSVNNMDYLFALGVIYEYNL